jgi:hypothetical protein
MEGSGLPPLPPPPPPPQEPPYQPGYNTPQVPYQGPPQRSGLPAWAIVLIVLGVLAVLGVGGCAAVAVIVGNKASDTIDKGLHDVQNINAITDEQARGIELGATRAQVISELGPPFHTSVDCIDYNVRNASLGDQWQFCFTASGDRLLSKRKT